MTAAGRPLNVAIAGFGNVGRSVARILCEGRHRALRLVGVCTRRPAEGRRDATWMPPEVVWTDDIHTLLFQEVLDLLFVEDREADTGNRTTFPQFPHAFQAGNKGAVDTHPISDFLLG